MSVLAWQGDWNKRITERVHAYGFASVTAFVEAHPGTSLLALADQLGEDIAAVQLERMWLDEAEMSGEIERCARDLLARQIRHNLPEGWHSDWRQGPSGVEGARFRTAKAVSGWSAPMKRRFPAHREAISRILAFFDETPLPNGWSPAGPDDELLVEIFRSRWLSDSRTQEDGGL